MTLSLLPSKTNPLNIFSETKTIHPAIKYFHELHTNPPSAQLQEFFSSFAQPKSIDASTFEEGVKKFIQWANSNPLKSELGDRQALYGTVYAGLHYSDDLVTLWNSTHGASEHINIAQIASLAPKGWDSTHQDGVHTLIYKGQKPAQALDELLKGPTVIDCGMYAQLSLWFGIRNMLGNERFNQCFGRAPFFITQCVYNGIEHSDEPYNGNSLYSFLTKKEAAEVPTVVVKHIKNSPLYPLKHPVGDYGGENCVVIDKKYYIFDPFLKNNQGISESEVLSLLRQAFNEERNSFDMDRLSLYAQTPEELHPHHLLTFGQLAASSESLRDAKLSQEEMLQIKQNPSLELSFDLQKFSSWLQAMEHTTPYDPSTYSPLEIDYSHQPADLLNAIPFENKKSMDFSNFKQDTPQQKELMTTSKQFCHNVMANTSQLVILTGKAGVGKTASAVCAAKELAARGKKVAWISEVMVNGWADQAKSLADLGKCEEEINRMLATNPDVVFLDDNNLSGFSGKVLLEKIYSWYVQHPGKGLYITSNDPISFKKCYGYQLYGQYKFPPFGDYTSPQYMNWNHKTNVTGESLRSKREGQSIGAVVSESVWKSREAQLGPIELIPAFDEEELAPIRQSLRAKGSKGPAYEKLSPLKQRWIQVHEAGGMYHFDGYGRSHYEERFLTANPSKFEKSTFKTIALEIAEFDFLEKKIDYVSMQQLLRVLNYAHDQGGRRIILINKTTFSNEQLLSQIKKQIPSSERERTWSRFMLLLCETEDSIFKQNQFKGQIESVVEKRQSVGRFVESKRNRFFSEELSQLEPNEKLHLDALKEILDKLEEQEQKQPKMLLK